MAAEEKPVHEQVADLLAGWNAPPNAHDMERLIGGRVPEGDTRATAAVRPGEMDHARNVGSDKVDAERLFADDGDDGDDEESVSYSDMTNDELRDELERRDLPKSGNKDELIARLEEDDEEDDEEE